MSLPLFSNIYASGKKPDGPFKYYEYRSTTMREYPHEFYRLEATEEHGLTLSWAKSNSPVTVLRVPENAAQELKALVEEYKLYRLRHMYTPPFDVRDGIMWHVYFTIGECDISCNGDNAWPPGKLREGIEAINAYFNKLIEASTEEDVIEVRKER